MALTNRPSIKFLNQALIYRDGALYWQVRPREHFSSDQSWRGWNTSHAGSEAGSPTPHSNNGDLRWVVGLYGQIILRSHLVWALCHQEWPILQVDHKDQDKLNDRIENLRLATGSQNQHNRGKYSTNKSGFKGVSWYSPSSRWVAKIGVNGLQMHIGYFNTPEEAHAAYREAAVKYHKEFACFG